MNEGVSNYDGLFYVAVFVSESMFVDILFLWEGVAQSHLKPIYLGNVLLSSLFLIV